MKRRKTEYPVKRYMNLYYKPDRTTKPATVALYVLFAAVCMLGLCKILIYDLCVEVMEARYTLEEEEDRLNGVLLELTDYDEVQERYNRYSATEEERALIDRMEILNLLDEAVSATADLDSIAISGDTVQIRFSCATLAQTAEIVRRLEASPIVAGITVSTASTIGDNVQSDGGGAWIQANALIRLQKEVEKE